MPLGQLVVIDDSYGKRPAYRLGASCTNCSWRGEYRRQMGVDPRPLIACPQCGCHKVRPTNEFMGTDE